MTYRDYFKAKYRRVRAQGVELSKRNGETDRRALYAEAPNVKNGQNPHALASVLLVVKHASRYVFEVYHSVILTENKTNQRVRPGREANHRGSNPAPGKVRLAVGRSPCLYF